jgi:tetrathionate reductase subunit B
MENGQAKQKKWGMALDVERCIGCHACSVACKVENSVSLGSFRTKVYYYDFPAVNPHNNKETMKRSFLPTLCMHCEDAPCLSACPTEAISRGPDGIIRINESECDGNRDCIKACPYGAIHIDPVSKVADKCDLCSHRLAVDMEPACVEVCPAEVYVFGDLNDPASKISTFLKKNEKEISVLKPHENTKPSVKYRGIGTVVPREMENKIPKGRNHDPFSYEIDTWGQLQSEFSPAADKKS